VEKYITAPPTGGDKVYWFSLFVDIVNRLSELLDAIHRERIKAREEAREDREAFIALTCSIIGHLDETRTAESLMEEVRDFRRKTGKTDDAGEGRVS
jgi:hypothetical protein